MNFVRRIRGKIKYTYDRQVIRAFHKLAYERSLWATTTWMGRRVMQYPSDLLVKQEIIAKVRPDLLIECGTAWGGSALFYAHIMDLLGHGRVLSIDLDPKPDLPVHARIEYFTGSSVSRETIEFVRSKLPNGGSVMIALDSLHTEEHVLKELNAYHSLVTVGSYLIVEDSEINGHPVFTAYELEKGPGPFEAIEKFLPNHPEFVQDSECERYLVTHHPGGYLRRVR